jgi:hypothetical protein
MLTLKVLTMRRTMGFKDRSLLTVGLGAFHACF